MKCRIVNNCDLCKTDILRIAELKDQHWPYGIDSQLDWMRKNIQDGDSHLIVEGQLENRPESNIFAYVTLTMLQVSLDSKEYKAIGVGGVCVDKTMQNCGIGRQLMNTANSYIIDNKSMGILLCKERLVGFYKKCNWHSLNYKTAIVDGSPFIQSILFFNSSISSCDSIIIDRCF